MNTAVIMMSAVAALCAGVSAAIWLKTGCKNNRLLSVLSFVAFACNVTIVIARGLHG